MCSDNVRGLVLFTLSLFFSPVTNNPSSLGKGQACKPINPLIAKIRSWTDPNMYSPMKKRRRERPVEMPSLSIRIIAQRSSGV